jgi:hypothetical protein
MMFYIGLHHPGDAKHFERAFISVHALKGRKAAIGAGAWVMDSGAFTTIQKHRGYPEGVEVYAAEIRRWASPSLVAAVSQDFRCEPDAIALTGLSVAEHQRLTIGRYDGLLRHDLGGVCIMPVLQGRAPEDYLAHLDAYGERLGLGAYVGVGTLCKRNGRPEEIIAILRAILEARPDLRLHGFGLKLTALGAPAVCARLHSADSMAWSFAARRQGRNANSWLEAARFVERIDNATASRDPATRGRTLSESQERREA